MLQDPHDIGNDAAGIQEHAPHDCDDGGGEHPWHDVEDPEQAPDERVHHAGVQQQGERQAEKQVEDHAHHREIEDVAQRYPERRVSKDGDVVLKPHEHGVRPHYDAVQKGITDNGDDRDEHEQGKEDERR